MVGDGANDIIAMRQAASSFSLSSSETKLINAFNDKKTDEVIPSTTPSSFRTFWNFVSKYSNNDGSSEFSLCTIGSSFFTNSSNPNGLLHILKQSKSSTAFVKYFGLMSISFAVFDFFFTLVTLKSHIKLAESNLMLEAYILLIASTLAMAPSLNVDEKIPNNLSVKSNSLYSLKLGSTFAFSLLADLSILLYFQHYVSLNFSGKCTNDLNMSIISPCKAIFMYLFIMVELLSFYIYYPGKKFIEPINRTKLFKYLFMVIPAILFMAWQGLSPGNAFEPIVQFEFPKQNTVYHRNKVNLQSQQTADSLNQSGVQNQSKGIFRDKKFDRKHSFGKNSMNYHQKLELENFNKMRKHPNTISKAKMQNNQKLLAQQYSESGQKLEYNGTRGIISQDGRFERIHSTQFYPIKKSSSAPVGSNHFSAHHDGLGDAPGASILEQTSLATSEAEHSAKHLLEVVSAHNRDKYVTQSRDLDNKTVFSDGNIWSEDVENAFLEAITIYPLSGSKRIKKDKD
ncbi:MAG: hypothetical protein MHMPM18_003649, partial [Marteilia pararefringens]